MTGGVAEKAYVVMRDTPAVFSKGSATFVAFFEGQFWFCTIGRSRHATNNQLNSALRFLSSFQADGTRNRLSSKAHKNCRSCLPLLDQMSL